jgi:hypothetical protein
MQPLRAWIVAAAVLGAVSTVPGQTGDESRDGAATVPAAGGAGAQADVPVRGVVLFSSGVGYFEHSGKVSGDARTELRFKSEQINDILKSLVLEDLDAGTVRTVTYPSQDPVEKILRSFQIDIADNPNLAELLNRLRGAQVTLQTGEGRIDGTVLGVEQKQVPGGKDQQPITVSVINLLAAGTIQAVELPQVRSIELKDAQLQQELNQALAALAQARDQDKKPVVIDFSGAGERRVRLGYVVQTPVWKTSYRLVLGGANDKPRLQGWAIVENQTDNDWKDVQLSLVSGRPISFVQDLYQPLYVQRPVVEPELYSSLRPQRYGAGFATGGAAADEERQNVRAAPAMAPRAAEMMARKLRSAGEAGQALADQSAAPAQPLDIGRSVQSVAQAAEVGELFQYTVANVTLARQKSAMLPIVTDEIDVERLSIYNQAVLAQHPLNGARLKNTTGKHLLAGPITVFDGGSYAGDAQIENLPPDQQRLLSYGIDLKMRVNAANHQSKADVLTGRIVKGILEVTYKNVQSREYVVENKAEQDRTLILEHPVIAGWELVDSPTPEETTEHVHRFRVKVPAGKQERVKVAQQFIQAQTIALLPLDIGSIAAYHSTQQIPQPVRDALARAMDLKRALVQTERQMAETQKKLDGFPAQQTRMRENMKVLERNSELYIDYMKRLKAQEQEIIALQNELDTLRKKQDDQRKALEDYLSSLNVG